MLEPGEFHLGKRLDLYRAKGRLRGLHDDRAVQVDLCSNDYLGFARSGELWRRWRGALNESEGELGSTGSRLLTGHSQRVEALEEQVACMFRSVSALVFPSGYSLNLGLLQALSQPKDIVLMDQFMHASAKDGMRLGRGQGFFFRHNDVDHLGERLRTFRRQKDVENLYVVVESIYSMSGERAPLIEISRLCHQFGASLIVDEAHAMGTVGTEGLGCVVDLGLEKEVFARVMTFGKAFGAAGAALLGRSRLRQYMINFCHSFIYSTAMSHPSLLLIQEALQFFQETKSAVLSELRENQREFMKTFSFAGERDRPVYNFRLPCAEALSECARELEQSGISVLPIRPPTVKKGLECLRVSIHAFNTRSEFEGLYKVLKNYEGFWRPFFCHGN